MTSPSVLSQRVRVTVPHDGAGTHTLLVALPVDDAWLADADQDREIVREVARLARQTLRAHRARMLLVEVCEQLGCTDVELRSRRRDPQLTDLRRAAARRMRDAGLSTPVIGAALDRDHTTVLWLLGRTARPTDDAELTCEDCDRSTLAGSRWCGVGRCVNPSVYRWSWSRKVSA